MAQCPGRPPFPGRVPEDGIADEPVGSVVAGSVVGSVVGSGVVDTLDDPSSGRSSAPQESAAPSGTTPISADDCWLSPSSGLPGAPVVSEAPIISGDSAPSGSGLSASVMSGVVPSECGTSGLPVPVVPGSSGVPVVSGSSDSGASSVFVGRSVGPVFVPSCGSSDSLGAPGSAPGSSVSPGSSGSFGS